MPIVLESSEDVKPYLFAQDLSSNDVGLPSRTSMFIKLSQLSFFVNPYHIWCILSTLLSFPHYLEHLSLNVGDVVHLVKVVVMLCHAVRKVAGQRLYLLQRDAAFYKEGVEKMPV